MKRARTELLRVLQKSLRPVRVDKPVPINYELDTWVYRSYREALYGANLSTFYNRSWNHMAILDPSALLFERKLLRADLRVQKKSLAADYVDYIKWERLARSRTGFLAPYQCLEIDRIRP